MAGEAPLLPGVPAAFAEQLLRTSGLQDMPVVEAGSDAMAAAALFKEHGFVVIRGALMGEPLTRLRAKAAAVMDDIVRSDPDGLGSRGPRRYSFGGCSTTGSQLHHLEWAALVDVPAVTAVLDEIWESKDYACHTAGGDFCLAGAPGHQNLHADAWTPGCEEWEVAPLICVNYLVDDQTAFNGPLRVVPGTHRRDASQAPKVDEEIEQWILSTMCPVPAGTAIIRDLRTWHGGTPNLTTNHRAMPNAEFMAPWRLRRRGGDSDDVVDITPAMPRELWAALSERGRHLARFLPVEEGGEPLKAEVCFDLGLGSRLAQNFFDGFQLAPLFKECGSAVIKPVRKKDGNCAQS